MKINFLKHQDQINKQTIINLCAQGVDCSINYDGTIARNESGRNIDIEWASFDESLNSQSEMFMEVLVEENSDREVEIQTCNNAFNITKNENMDDDKVSEELYRANSEFVTFLEDIEHYAILRNTIKIETPKPPAVLKNAAEEINAEYTAYIIYNVERNALEVYEVLDSDTVHLAFQNEDEDFCVAEVTSHFYQIEGRYWKEAEKDLKIYLKNLCIDFY